MKGKGREIEKATDLIFDLENVSKILSGWDRTVRAIDSILPRVPSLLYAVPYQEKKNSLMLNIFDNVP